MQGWMWRRIGNAAIDERAPRTHRPRPQRSKASDGAGRTMAATGRDPRDRRGGTSENGVVMRRMTGGVVTEVGATEAEEGRPLPRPSLPQVPETEDAGVNPCQSRATCQVVVVVEEEEWVGRAAGLVRPTRSARLGVP